MLEDGRIFSLVAMVAVLFFLVERTLPADSPLRRICRILAVAVLAGGLVAAVVSSVLWVSGDRG